MAVSAFFISDTINKKVLRYFFKHPRFTSPNLMSLNP